MICMMETEYIEQYGGLGVQNKNFGQYENVSHIYMYICIHMYICIYLYICNIANCCDTNS